MLTLYTTLAYFTQRANESVEEPRRREFSCHLLMSKIVFIPAARRNYGSSGQVFCMVKKSGALDTKNFVVKVGMFQKCKDEPKKMLPTTNQSYYRFASPRSYKKPCRFCRRLRENLGDKGSLFSAL